jgi:hypothetical protein
MVTFMATTNTMAVSATLSQMKRFGFPGLG